LSGETSQRRGKVGRWGESRGRRSSTEKATKKGERTFILRRPKKKKEGGEKREEGYREA